MRWFASYWATVALCLVAAGLYWLSQQEIGPVDDRLDWLVPGGLPTWWTIPLLVAGCYALVRAILHRVLAYTESAIDASPRAEGGRGRRRAAAGNAAYAAFGNPTGWWLAPFVAVLAAVGAFAGAVRFGINATAGWTPSGWDLFVNLLLALAILYALTVASAMLFPDRPQPLRLAPEPEPDPVLAVPDAGAEPEGTRRRGLFGRRSGKPPAEPRHGP